MRARLWGFAVGALVLVAATVSLVGLPAASSPSASVSVGTVCGGGSDGHWIYHGSVSASEGFVLDQLRLGPRLLVKRVSVPYFYWYYQGEHPTQLTVSASDAGAGFGSTTLEDVVCDDHTSTARAGIDGELWPYSDPSNASSGGLDAVRLRYRVNGTPPGLTIHVYENFVFAEPLAGDHCEPSGEISCARFWPNIAYDMDIAPNAPPNLWRQVGELRVIQRLNLMPDGTTPGTVNVFRDIHGSPNTQPDTRETAGTFIFNGQRLGACPNRDGCTWDNYHQSGRGDVKGPGLVPPGPGCVDCVHWHFAWDGFVNVGSFSHFTDGHPEILDASQQTVNFARVVAHDTEVPSPFTGGYDRLQQSGPGSNKPEKLDGKHSILYLDSTSDGIFNYAHHIWGDSFSPELDNVRHGGNGSMWFAPAAVHDDKDCLQFTKGSPTPVLDPQTGTPRYWTVPVTIAQDPRYPFCKLTFNIAHGPYYVLSPAAALLNPDPAFAANPIGDSFITIPTRVTTKTKSVMASLAFASRPSQSDLDALNLAFAPSFLPYTPYVGTAAPPAPPVCNVSGETTTTGFTSSFLAAAAQPEAPASMTIEAIDATTGCQLPGVGIRLMYDANNDGTYETHITDFESTADPTTLSNLAPGKYEILETYAPLNYVAAASEIPFELAAGASPTITVQNYLCPTDAC